MDDAILIRDLPYLIVVVGSVHIHIIVEVLAQGVVPSDAELDTGVLHIAPVDIRGPGSGRGEYGRLHQPVFGLLVVPVEVDIELAKGTGVNTEVELL